jgi:hypothetical protein
MSKNVLLSLSLAGLAAGCASTASPDSASPTAAAAADASSGLASSEPPVDVVTADKLLVDFDGSLGPNPIVCREMLQQASNVIVRRCMAEKKWRTYDRAQEEWARQFLRRVQGGW